MLHTKNDKTKLKLGKLKRRVGEELEGVGEEGRKIRLDVEAFKKNRRCRKTKKSAAPREELRISFIVQADSSVKLHLDFNFNTTRKFELHESIDSLGVRAVDVDETLVSRNLKLLAALLVYEGRAVHSDDTLASGERNWTANDSASSLYVANNLLSRLFYESVIVALELDTNFLTHCCIEFAPYRRRWDKSRSLSHLPNAESCF
jgi:hypothetical protein